MNVECYEKNECRLCKKTHLEQVLELAPTPPGNHFVEKSQCGTEQTNYPLALKYCTDCFHVQLSHVVDPSILFRRNYSYVSSTSPVFIDHLTRYAESISNEYSIPQGSLVLDVGSNDGTALSCFNKLGYKTLGVDPATEIAQIANGNGIETLCEFFSLDIAKRYKPQYGEAKLINSHNVCAHIDDLESVVKGIQHWLADDGLFVMEVGYFVNVYDNVWFDTIYHEHLDYHTVTPLVQFFDRLGMEVINVKNVDSQGGSIRVVSQKKGGARKVNPSVQYFVDLEKNKHFDQSKTIKQFGTKINKIKAELNKLISTLNVDGKKIAGYGAPTKATTLLSYFELQDYLSYIVDDNPMKQNLYTPGHHIPVYPVNKIQSTKPDYLLVLSWNFADEIMHRNIEFAKTGGKFILPMPTPKVVSYSNGSLHEEQKNTCNLTTP